MSDLELVTDIVVDTQLCRNGIRRKIRMSHDIANRGEILLYDITISILETVRQDTMYISEFDRQTERYLKGE